MFNIKVHRDKFKSHRKLSWNNNEINLGTTTNQTIQAILIINKMKQNIYNNSYDSNI